MQLSRSKKTPVPKTVRLMFMEAARRYRDYHSFNSRAFQEQLKKVREENYGYRIIMTFVVSSRSAH